MGMASMIPPATSGNGAGIGQAITRATCKPTRADPIPGRPGLAAEETGTFTPNTAGRPIATATLPQIRPRILAFAAPCRGHERFPHVSLRGLTVGNVEWRRDACATS